MSDGLSVRCLIVCSLSADSQFTGRGARLRVGGRAPRLSGLYRFGAGAASGPTAVGTFNGR
jgi:hypothetical protein